MIDKQFFIVLLAILVMDAIWLGVIAKKGYQETIMNVQGSKLKMRIWPLIFLYPLMAWCINTFVLKNDSVKKEDKWKYGALLGLLIYGVYNGTNHAIFNDWNLETSIKDTLWGPFVIGAATWFATKM